MNMKKYKVTVKNGMVFRLLEKDYVCKKGDVVELPEEHITTQALLERKRIVETVVETGETPSAPHVEPVPKKPKDVPKSTETVPKSTETVPKSAETVKKTSKTE